MPVTPIGFPSTGTVDYYYVDKDAALTPAPNARPRPRAQFRTLSASITALSLSFPPFAFAPAYPTPRIDTEHSDTAMHRRG
jgi:hypothetical protein